MFDKLIDYMIERFSSTFIANVVVLFIAGIFWLLAYAMSLVTMYFWNNTNPMFGIIVGVVTFVFGMFTIAFSYHVIVSIIKDDGF